MVGNCDGFVGNRMLAPYAGEAKMLTEEGMGPTSPGGPRWAGNPDRCSEGPENQYSNQHWGSLRRRDVVGPCD